jgi:hypothetical protein
LTADKRPPRLASDDPVRRHAERRFAGIISAFSPASIVSAYNRSDIIRPVSVATTTRICPTRPRPRTDARGLAPRPRTRRRPAPAPPARPASVTVSRTAPVMSAPPFPARTRSGKSPSRRAGTHRDARSTRHRASSQDTRPARPVRGRPCHHDGAHRPSWWHGRPSAMRPWMPQHSALQCYKVTHAGTKQNGPHSRTDAASGPFPQVVAGVGFEPT